jgi:hypothetical protein
MPVCKRTDFIRFHKDASRKLTENHHADHIGATVIHAITRMKPSYDVMGVKSSNPAMGPV